MNIRSPSRNFPSVFDETLSTRKLHKVSALIALSSVLAATNAFARPPWLSQAQAPEHRPVTELPTSFLLTDVIIGLERTHCFGPCPVYKVEIFGDGRVRYEGRDYVEEVGVRETAIQKSEVLELLNDIYMIRFFQMEDRYDFLPMPYEEDGVIEEYLYSTTDMPSRIITVRIGGYEKRVEDYFCAPKQLFELSTRIDNVAGTEKWVGEQQESSRCRVIEYHAPR